MIQQATQLLRQLISTLKKLVKQNWGIRGRVLVLALAPAAAIAIALSVFFIHVQVDDLQKSLEERAQALVNLLAKSSSHYPLVKNNTKLHQLVKMALGEADILNITILDSAQQAILDEHNPNDQQTQLAPRFKIKSAIIKEFSVKTDSKTPQLDGRTIGWVIGEFTHKSTTTRKHWVIVEGFFITLFGLTISMILALRLGKNVTEPIIRLTETVRGMAEGKLTASISEKTKGEIGALEQNISSMGTVIKETQDYLQKKVNSSTTQLRSALTEMEAQNDELQKARQQALDMSLIKTEFLANMSHELRTPLNGILGFTNLLLKTRMDAIQSEHVSTIKQSTTALLTIINDTLDFSRIEAGNFRIDTLPFNLREIVEDAVTLLTPTAYDKGLDLIVMIYSDVPRRLISDPVRIRQIITNLVSNAIKFTHKGCIALRVALEEESSKQVLIKVSVQDSGVGITPKEQAQLFKPYIKASDSLAGAYSSVQLGLVICKKLVENMAGDIGVESKPAQGSTFWFTFRASVDKSNTEPSNNNPLRRRRCLLYDAHELSRLAIVHQISDWGMEIDEADSLEQLQQLMKPKAKTELNYNIVLITLNKEEIETHAFKHLMQSISYPVIIPIVVLVTSVNKSLSLELVDQGASLVVPKTIRAQQLFDKIYHMLAGNQAQQSPGKINTNKPAALDLDLSGVNVLVVDDNKINRKLIEALLKERSANILQAKHGRQAIELFASQHIDFILMDIQMPTMDGLEATKKIRAIEHGRQRTPIVALTANIMEGDQERFIRAGFDDFIVKPIQEIDLLELISKWITTDPALPLLAQTATPARAPTLPTKPLEPVSKMFDRKQALRLTGGNIQLATELFHMLVTDLPNMKAKLNQFIATHDYAKLELVAHKINGAASYCAVNAIKNSANLLEVATRARNDADIQKNIQLLNNDIDALLQEQQELITSNIPVPP